MRGLYTAEAFAHWLLVKEGTDSVAEHQVDLTPQPPLSHFFPCVEKKTSDLFCILWERKGFNVCPKMKLTYCGCRLSFLNSGNVIKLPEKNCLAIKHILSVTYISSSNVHRCFFFFFHFTPRCDLKSGSIGSAASLVISQSSMG